MRLVLVSVVLSCCLRVAAQDVREPGTFAPEIQLQKVLQAPAGSPLTLNPLRGKVVVLEFWATWCPSCIKQLPHLNRLAEQLAGEPVVFISITDEDEKTVASFLEHTAIRGWVGLNTTGSIFNSYKIDQGRPLTVVIGPDGRIDARVRPWARPFPIAAENLRCLAAGKPSGIESSRFIFSGIVRDPQTRPLAGANVELINPLGSADEWQQIGQTTSDIDGRFTIDHEDPLSYYSGHPIELRVNGVIVSDDLRALTTDQRRTLVGTLPVAKKPD